MAGGLFLEGCMDTNDLLSYILMSGGGQYQTPAQLNALRQSQRTTQMKDWTTSKDTAYNTQRQSIQRQFADLGMPDAAAPYLSALDSDYKSAAYTPGTDYSLDPANPGSSGAWNEQAYLAQHPDVASNIASTNANPKSVSDPNYWHSGLDFYNAVGKSSPGYEVPGYGKADVAPGMLGGTPDTFTDPNQFTTKDYGVDGAVTGIRQGRKDAAYGTANQTLDQRLSGLGLGEADTNLLRTGATNKLQSLYNTAGTSANDYSSVFDPNAVLDSVMGTERTGRRQQYTTAAKSAFNGLDPSLQLGDTADDQYINDIVGSSYSDALGGVDRAYKRGALTSTGYQAGLDALGKQKSAADATAQTLGGAVLTRDRGALSSIKDSAVTDAGGWDFGQSYDPSKYTGQYNDKLGEVQGGLGGEISSALQGQNFFDVGEALNKGGYAQGAQNTNALTSGYTTPAAAAVAGARDKNKTDTRGLSGTGLF
jgi:hypothetical protein